MPDLLPLPDPTIHRRRLRSELRRAREAAGFAQRDVAAAMDWSLSKLLRIETGAVSIATNDLKVLLAHYGITEQARVDSLVVTARASRERSPWSAYKDLGSPQFISYLAYEAAASVIRSYQSVFVPGLLQTEEYAREVLGLLRGPDQRMIDRLVDLRLTRQEVLDADDPPSVHFILDEAVISRAVGSPDLMRRQLRRLEEAATAEHITIRIVQFSAGLYARIGVPYTVFEFPDPENEDVLFIEDAQGDFTVRDMVIRESSPAEPGSEPHPVDYLDSFFALEQVARREDTAGLISAAIRRLSSEERADRAG
jgi:transcriptional regulator with XRE-family HTH domain